MFELTLGSKRTCDGVTRREVLRVGALTALGLSLPGYLAIRAEAAGPRAGRDVSCILLWLQGGISDLLVSTPSRKLPRRFAVSSA